MGVEFRAVSGPGRWLQGCMRVRLLWPDINDWSPMWSPLVSNGPCNGRLFSELAKQPQAGGVSWDALSLSGSSLHWESIHTSTRHVFTHLTG